MAQFERIRDLVTGPLNPDHIKQRQEAGWTLAALEWTREVSDSKPAMGPLTEDVPYGMRVADDCLHLEEDPQEMGTLMLMMELLINEKRVADVALELNENGYTARNSVAWTPVMIFNMFPRLIEMGPRIFSTDEWEERKKKLLRPVG